MAADESAQFQRWSATTNVDETVLEQMSADVGELAWREQIDSPATTYARLLGARDDVFRLIAGHQQPHHTTSAEYRTVPITGRARSLHIVLAQRTDLASGTLTALRDDLARFVTHPAPTPPQLEPGTTT